MKRIFLSALIIVIAIIQAFATHQRAGEITYKRISGFTYEVTIVTYSYAPSEADRNELELNWGDGTSSILTRVNGPAGINPAGISCDHLGEMVDIDIKKNLYTGTHTYAGASTYIIWLEDPNRNLGIQNIPNSVEIPLYIESQLVISPFLGANSSPELLLPPIDKGCVDHPFLHNPGAIDPDGDSLSYKTAICRGAGGENIPGYLLPNKIGDAGQTFKIDSITGDIVWDSPKIQGEYNIAFYIEEWRNGIKIGYIVRDMQITIVTCDNEAPEILAHDTCVIAGDTLKLFVTATDPDNDSIYLTATGAPFAVNNSPATFSEIDMNLGFSKSLLQWNTDCLHVRKNTYPVYLKAIDNSEPVKLFDLQTIEIKVIGPAPENLTAIPLGNDIHLNWDPYQCDNAVTFEIYRKNGTSGYSSGQCETGVPAQTGYKLIGSTALVNTSYIDNNNGEGLTRGIDYCYLIIAKFADGAESQVSNEVCVHLKKDIPLITNVTVESTSQTTGSIKVIWSKPTEIDPVQAPGPYKYRIYRSAGMNVSNETLIDSLPGLNDTIYLDNNLNTLTNGFTYRIELINNTPDNRFSVGFSKPATSVFLVIQPLDRKLKLDFAYNVPWTNFNHTIFNKNSSGGFDSLASTSRNYYFIEGLENGKEYCFKVKTTGSYYTAGIYDPLINLSQVACGIPRDVEAPCPPVPEISTDCNLSQNILTWTFEQFGCYNDAKWFYIFYKRDASTDFVVIDSVTANSAYSFIHSKPETLSGCYGIKVSDQAGNLSEMSDTVCVDPYVCGGYRLPNVFTPNGDGKNDYFIPFPYTGVEKISLHVFNRWNQVIFKTEDPDINWDGKILGTNQPASDGAYYYSCDVYEIKFSGVEKRTIYGVITILR